MSIDEVLANQRPWWVEQGDALSVLKTMPDETLKNSGIYAINGCLNRLLLNGPGECRCMIGPDTHRLILP